MGRGISCWKLHGSYDTTNGIIKKKKKPRGRLKSCRWLTAYAWSRLIIFSLMWMWWVLYKEMQPREGPPHFLQIKRWPFKIIKINCLQFPFKYSIMFIYEDRRWLFHRIGFNPIIMCVDSFKQSILLGRAWLLVIGVQYSSMCTTCFFIHVHTLCCTLQTKQAYCPAGRRLNQFWGLKRIVSISSFKKKKLLLKVHLFKIKFSSFMRCKIFNQNFIF